MWFLERFSAISVSFSSTVFLSIGYIGYIERKTVACSRLSISGSERKQRRAKNQAIQGERAGARVAPSSLPRPSSFFPRSSAARRTDPLTEGLEQTRKTVELKLTEIALNRSKNHIGEITTDRGLQVRSFFIKNSFAFLI